MTAVPAGFADLLAVDLAHLQFDDIININSMSRPRYIQACQNPDHLYVETTGDPDIAPARLDESERLQLIADGWRPPDPPDECGWHRRYTWPLTAATAREAAHYMIDIIERILGDPADNAVRAWNYESDAELQLESIALLRTAWHRPGQ
jgi:hypothetical protein